MTLNLCVAKKIDNFQSLETRQGLNRLRNQNIRGNSFCKIKEHKTTDVGRISNQKEFIEGAKKKF